MFISPSKEKRCVIEYYSVKPDRTSTGVQRVRLEQHADWLLRIENEQIQGKVKNPRSEYSELISRDTSEVFEDVLYRKAS